MKYKCKFCNHVSTQHHSGDDVPCKTIGCFCRASKWVIEKVEGLNQ